MSQKVSEELLVEELKSPKEKQKIKNGSEDIKKMTSEGNTGQDEIPKEKDSETAENSSKKSKSTKTRSTTSQIKNGVEKVETDIALKKSETDTKEKKAKEEKKTEPSKEQIKSQKNDGTNGNDMKSEETDTEISEEGKTSEEINTTDEFIMDSESYMDPLVLQTDEPCPELEFEESSDKDSGKYSPIISRCKTRRSEARNIPTPKTPKSLDDQESENGTTPTTTPDPEELPKSTLPKDFNETDNSSNTDNLSTKVQVGNSTRLDFSESESYFLSSLKNTDTNTLSRNISSRRSIRPFSDDIRKRNFKNSIQRANMSMPFSSRDSVERAPSVKRKSRSETPEDRKRFKDESPGFIAKITSPLSSLRNKFVGAPNSTSTPKLTSFRDQKNHFGGDFFDQMETPGQVVQAENKWCSIM